jgi:diguanylate cyclase
LRGLVHADHLAGALNRSGLEHVFTRKAARADRKGTPLGTAVLDIDDFKLLNDRHDHQAGDDALVHFAQIIKRRIRPSDVVVRFGGEELLSCWPILAPNKPRALCAACNKIPPRTRLSI